MATLYRIGEQPKEVTPENGTYFTYEELKHFVEGMVEIVPLPSGKSIIVNEEGKLIGLEKNQLASELWKWEYPISKYPMNNDETICGNALIVSENELQNE